MPDLRETTDLTDVVSVSKTAPFYELTGVGVEAKQVSERPDPLEKQDVLTKNLGAIGSLPDSRFRVRTPIPYEIERTEGQVYAWQRDLGLCESGYDDDEALFELEEFMMDDYLNLISVPRAELSRDALRMIERYERFIEFLGDVNSGAHGAD